MKKVFFGVYITLCLVSRSDKESSKDYPVIDVFNSIGNYQRVYCSELFSSIELIPLETTDDCLIGGLNLNILLNDSVIIIRDIIANLSMINREHLYAFDRTGKFMNEIGRRGQGPGDYISLLDIFFNTERPTMYVTDNSKILEYDFSGRFIHSVQRPRPDDISLYQISYVREDLFVGQAYYDGKNRFKYCLFNHKGDTIKTFPSHIFFDKDGSWVVTNHGGLYPVRVDNRIYLKDYINDTLYVFEKLDLQPAYVFSFGKYSISKESLAVRNLQSAKNEAKINKLLGMPNYFFYNVRIPEIVSRPKSKPEHSHIDNSLLPTDGDIYGLYNIAQNKNILLDTDDYFQKGIINDMNGGLPFIPKYYAGNNVIVDVWNVTDMQEMLTEDYFAKQTIKDPQAYRKLKELLKNLKDDDNPVIVVAKLK